MGFVYKYKLWDGKTTIGIFSSSVPISGAFLRIPEEHRPKVRYARKAPEFIKLPLKWIKTEELYNKQTFEMVILVQRKSERQLEHILRVGRNEFDSNRTDTSGLMYGDR